MGAFFIYWYRPTEVRDEATGEIIGYKKKFKLDLLQRTYKQITEMFGCSSGQAKEAIVFLEKMEVVKRVFRSLDLNGGSAATFSILRYFKKRYKI